VLAAVPGRTGEGIGAAVAEHRSLGCCAESGPNNLSDVLAQASAVAPRLPGGASFAGAIAALLGAYAVVLAMVISLTTDTAGVDDVLTFFAAGSLVAAATTAFATLRGRSREWIDEVAPDGIAVPAGLRTTLAAHGLSQVEVRLAARGSTSRTFGGLRRAWIVLSHASIHDRAGLPFVLWHELAHAARRDGARRWVANTFGYAVFLASVFTAEVPAAAAGALGVLLVRTANRWISELACDRIAVAHAGADAARAWALRARDAPGLVARLRALLSHPPLAWRLAWAASPSRSRPFRYLG
jgi:Zn-dependent protease with chaperone function